MSKTHSLTQHDSQRHQGNTRAAQLQAFYAIKAKNAFISRQALFLGIAVLDKYHRATPDKSEPNSREVTLRATSALWIACKFLEKDHMPLKKFLSKVEQRDAFREEVVQMETEILQSIDFQLPFDSAYSVMTRAYRSTGRQCSSNKEVVSQCIAFLKEALLLSSEFSLCAELGLGILNLVESRTVTDKRIKQVCANIHNRTQRQRPNNQKTHEQVLSH